MTPGLCWLLWATLDPAAVAAGLGHPDYARRQGAAAWCQAFPGRAAPALVRLAGSPDPEVRRAVERLLGRSLLRDAARLRPLLARPAGWLAGLDAGWFLFGPRRLVGLLAAAATAAAPGPPFADRVLADPLRQAWVLAWCDLAAVTDPDECYPLAVTDVTALALGWDGRARARCLQILRDRIAFGPAEADTSPWAARRRAGRP